MSGRTLAAHLTRFAAARLRPRHPEWADALLAEHESLAESGGMLLWALGAVRASLATEPPDILYILMLPLSVLGVVLYQWSADEGVVTLLVVGAVGLCLGLLRPGRFVASGLAVGVVVTAVNGFESVCDVWPAYEIHHHSLIHDLRWLVFVIPALAATLLGRSIILRLQALHGEASSC